MTEPILCFDLDGTLLDASGRIHPRDCEILGGPSAVCLVPTTGRPLHAVRRLFERHGLFSGRPIPFPLVLQNGSLLYLPGEKLYSYQPFPAAEQAALLELARAHPQVTFMFFELSSIQMMWPRPFSTRAAANWDFIIHPFADSEPEPAFSKTMCVSETPADLERLHQATAGMPVERAYSMGTTLEITPLGADKGKGLLALQAALGLENSPVYAAGDGGNDLPLFKVANRTFAPLDCPLSLREAATQLIDVGAEGLLAPMLQAAGISSMG